APLFLGKQFYCMYVCPFGACQELVGKINPKHKLKISPKVAKWLRYLRYVLLVVLGALLCTSLDISIENFEPFSAFKFQFASLAVLILAGVMLVLSIFINRPWCTFLCPTGAFFSLFMKNTKGKENSDENNSTEK
ncbi:MAG: 4Fe-4S binding protein, partial [Bacteroidales bacterium]|nr:4Fe-4S binding protein [Bacteroidales bacterium]